MGNSDRFGIAEIKAVERQLGQAESMLRRYYCISQREWPRYSYEIKTMAEWEGPEFADEALAVVSKYECSMIGRRPLPLLKEFYGICLQDQNILEAASRSGEGINFESLMLYVLTHELVHIFRFTNSPTTYFAANDER